MIEPYYCEHPLKFKRPFHTAHGTREGTACILLRLQLEGQLGFGEATLPPYRNETIASVLEVWRSFPWASLAGRDIDRSNAEIEKIAGKDPSAAAAVSMAYYELSSKLTGKNIREILGIAENRVAVPNMFTIAARSANDIQDALQDGPACDAIKLKLDGNSDLDKINALTKVWNGPIFLDANQGWTDRTKVLELLEALAGVEVLGIEQPFSANDPGSHAWLSANTDTIIYADEAISNADQMRTIKGAYGGINVKLMKSGGLKRAFDLITEAKNANMKIMLGNMSESSCGTAAAMQLAPLVDLLDQDGPLLINNDPFRLHIEETKCTVELVSSYIRFRPLDQF